MADILEMAQTIATGGPLTAEAVEIRAAHVIGAALAARDAEIRTLRNVGVTLLERAEAAEKILKQHDEARAMLRPPLSLDQAASQQAEKNDG